MKRGAASRFVDGLWPQRSVHNVGFSSSITGLGNMVYLLAIAVALFFLGVFTFRFYSQHYSPLPVGTTFMGTDLSGMVRDDLEATVEGLLAQKAFPDVQVVVDYADRQIVFPFDMENLGFSYDVRASVDQILLEERSFLASVITDKLHKSAFEPILMHDGAFLEDVFEKITRLEQPMRQALIDFDDDWFVVPEQIGLEFTQSQQQELYQQLLRLQDRLNEEFIQIPVELEQTTPRITEPEVMALFTELQLVSQRSVEWTLDGERSILRLSENPDLLRIDMEKREVVLDEGKLTLYVQAFARSFDREPGEVLISAPVKQEKGHFQSTFDGDFHEGRSVDQNLMYEQLWKAFSTDMPYQIVELAFSTAPVNMEMADLGQLSLLSKGQSSFVLSHSEDRTFNVKKGLGKYNGVVIPQGSEFSFNDILGYVRYKDGWKPALAIFGGGGVQPVPGGGLCQVSTTTYRAAIHAGLQITQRKPHSLDVSYYRAYGDGIDSTIYPPEDIDLRFVNDTPGPIFVRTYTDDDAKEAFVEFYGVDDGRRVELKQLVNRPVNLEREVLYTDELPEGITEETKPRQGRYVEWEWKISRGEEEEYRKIETLYPARKRTIRIGTGPAQLSYQ
ncbi:MAG: VanW family protein [Candidatus Gracilibacteria bacterium]|nr:VanW family protein [Candidatus Gracilibacteria bacterium]